MSKLHFSTKVKTWGALALAGLLGLQLMLSGATAQNSLQPPQPTPTGFAELEPTSAGVEPTQQPTSLPPIITPVSQPSEPTPEPTPQPTALPVTNTPEAQPTFEPSQGTPWQPTPPDVPLPEPTSPPPSDPAPQPPDPALQPPPESSSPSLQNTPIPPAPTLATPTVDMLPTRPTPTRALPTPTPTPSPTPTSVAQARRQIGSLVYTYTSWAESPQVIGVRICVANWSEAPAQRIEARIEVTDGKQQLLRLVAPQPWSEVKVEPKQGLAVLEVLMPGDSATLEAYARTEPGIEAVRDNIRVSQARLLQPGDPPLPCPPGEQMRGAYAGAINNAEGTSGEAPLSVQSVASSGDQQAGRLGNPAPLTRDTLWVMLVGSLALMFLAMLGLYRLRRKQTNATQ